MTRTRCVAAAAVLLMACAGCNSSPTSSSGPSTPTTSIGKDKERPNTGERSAPVEVITVPGGGKSK